jgi:hypothetical protein
VDAFVGAPEGQMYLATVIQQNRADIVDDTGRIVTSDPAKRLQRNVALKWNGRGWLMLEVEKTE